MTLLPGTISLCVHACVHTCEGAHAMYTRVEARGSMSGIFITHSPPYFLNQHFSLNLELAISARLLASRTPGSTPLSLALRRYGYKHTLKPAVVWSLRTVLWVLMPVQQVLPPAGLLSAS